MAIGQPQNAIKGTPGEVRMTIGVTRKATGKTETYELVGKVTGDEAEQLTKEQANGSDPQHGSKKRGD